MAASERFRQTPEMPAFGRGCVKTLKTNFFRGHFTLPVVAIVDPGSIYAALLKIFS